MTLEQRIEAFSKVGLFIKRHQNNQPLGHEAQLHQGLDTLIEQSETYNNWFIPKFVKQALDGIGIFLKKEKLESFCKNIPRLNPKTIAVICAGNIPMVGFHDVMCVLLSGHKILIKLSSDDKILLPFFLKLLVHYEPLFEKQIYFAEGKLADFNAIIATGSNNTASHLHYYFGKYPNIIRKSRTSLAILTGKETSEDLKNLGKDIFLYFGLGCRNVSKLLVPQNYSFNHFFESIMDFGFVINNKKYGNNYDYHRAIYLLEKMDFLDNNFLMIRQSPDLYSPVASLHYSFYSDKKQVNDYVKTNQDSIQCIIGEGYTPFGYSQQPVITDFADNIDTREFLVNL